MSLLPYKCNGLWFWTRWQRALLPLRRAHALQCPHAMLHTSPNTLAYQPRVTVISALAWYNWGVGVYGQKRQLGDRDCSALRMAGNTHWQYPQVSLRDAANRNDKPCYFLRSVKRPVYQ
jgi:hypothetical protein